MRPIDADELLEHVGRDRLDTRERIMEMINNAPTIKEIPKPKYWDYKEYGIWQCSECGWTCTGNTHPNDRGYNYCPRCRADLRRKKR